LKPPQISIASPRDGEQVSQKGFRVVGFVDDLGARVTCVTATAQGTNRMGTSAGEDGFFSFPGVGFQSGTNHITIIATDDGGNASETNLVVYLKP
jgi:hypothetical protein